MKAICKECRAAVEFRNQHGNRLADMRCSCGGELARVVVHYDNEVKIWYFTSGGKKFVLNESEKYFLFCDLITTV